MLPLRSLRSSNSELGAVIWLLVFHPREKNRTTLCCASTTQVSALPPSSGSAGQLHRFYTGIVVEGGI